MDDMHYVPDLPAMTPKQRQQVEDLHRLMVQTLTSRPLTHGVVVAATIRTLAYVLAQMPDAEARQQTIGVVANVLPLYVNLFRPQKEK